MDCIKFARTLPFVKDRFHDGLSVCMTITLVTMDTYIYLSATPEALITSMLSPEEFGAYLSMGIKKRNRGQAIFVDLKLGELADNPLNGSAEHLPHTTIAHLKDCLEILKNEYQKQMKTVRRHFSGSLLYRTIGQGFFIGSGDDLLFYPYPDKKELEGIHYDFSDPFNA